MQNTITNNYNQAIELFNKGNFNQAIEFCQIIVNEDESHYQTWNLLGNIFFKLNDLDNSKHFFITALKIKPDLIEAYYMLGNVLFQGNLFEDAISIWKEALKFDQTQAMIYSNIAAAYLTLKDFDNAIDFSKQSININKNFEDPYLCLSKVYMQKNEEDAAFKYLTSALRINSKNPETNVDLSTIYFKKRDYPSAFKYYEYRKFIKEKKNLYDFMPFKKYTGKSLKNKALVIYHEQGFGDNIQFSRFLKDINCSNVSVGIQNSLNKLFSYSFPNINFIEEINSSDKFDYMLPIMSIPHFLKIDKIRKDPYLKVKNEDVILLKEKLSKDKLNIGIVWGGSKTGAFYKEKTLLLKNLESLFKNKKREFYSLQVDDYEELEHYPNIKNLGMNFLNFYDTAVAICALDLIISIDTAVAHLAGALGQKCFVLNNEAQFDWRWENTQQTSEWYNSVKVFKYIDIKQIINKIDKEINEL